MVKIFKIRLLSIFIALAFSFLQIVSVNANNLRHTSQRDNISFSVIEQEKKQAINTDTSYIPAVSYGTENGALAEGKVEKVVSIMGALLGIVLLGNAVSIIHSVVEMVQSIYSIIQPLTTS